MGGARATGTAPSSEVDSDEPPHAGTLVVRVFRKLRRAVPNRLSL
jgi:hypothetical protein